MKEANDKGIYIHMKKKIQLLIPLLKTMPHMIVLYYHQKIMISNTYFLFQVLSLLC